MRWASVQSSQKSLRWKGTSSQLESPRKTWENEATLQRGHGGETTGWLQEPTAPSLYKKPALNPCQLHPQGHSAMEICPHTDNLKFNGVFPQPPMNSQFTHTCGSLHLHLFSCSSYTWMAGSTHSMVNLVLSTCGGTHKQHLSLLLTSQEMRETPNQFVKMEHFTPVHCFNLKLPILSCRRPLSQQRGGKALLVTSNIRI